MTSAYKFFCQITKAAFFVTLAALLLLTAALLMFSGFLNPGEGQRLFIGLSCAGIYLIGSLFVIGDRFNAITMANLGILLNFSGAVFWVPLLGTNEWAFAVIGATLTLLWFVCIILKFVSDNRSPWRN